MISSAVKQQIFRGYKSVIKKTGNFFKTIKFAALAFNNENGLKLSASLSYYAIFALGPVLIIIISLAGIFFGRSAVQEKVFARISEIFGGDACLQIKLVIDNIQQSKHSASGTAIGAIILVISAVGVFTEIQGSINSLWSVKAKPEKKLFRKIKNSLTSFLLLMGTGLLLLATLIADSLMDLLSDQLKAYFSDTTISVFYGINNAIVFLITTLLFAIIFKILPDAFICWKDSFTGALFTAILFLTGKYLISLYISKSNIGYTYGSSAAIIAVLMWIYYSSIILYFGASFTGTRAMYYGKGIKPDRKSFLIQERE